MRCLIRLLLLAAGLPIALLILLCCQIHAQSTASIEGLILDQNGDTVDGVQLTASSPAIGVYRESVSDSAGRYQFTSLPVGEYVLQAQVKGFKKQVVEQIRLEVGR